MVIHSDGERAALVKAAEKAYIDAMLNKSVSASATHTGDFALIDLTQHQTRGQQIWIDGFFVTDRRFVGKDLSMMGLVEVAWQDPLNVIWALGYDGYCDSEAIPTHRSALISAYESRVFRGGRGPDRFVDEQKGYVYHNILKGENDFAHSEGVEIIQTLGSHPVICGRFNHRCQLFI